MSIRSSGMWPNRRDIFQQNDAQYFTVSIMGKDHLQEQFYSEFYEGDKNPDLPYMPVFVMKLPNLIDRTNRVDTEFNIFRTDLIVSCVDELELAPFLDMKEDAEREQERKTVLYELKRFINLINPSRKTSIMFVVNKPEKNGMAYLEFKQAHENFCQAVELMRMEAGNVRPEAVSLYEEVTVLRDVVKFSVTNSESGAKTIRITGAEIMEVIANSEKAKKLETLAAAKPDEAIVSDSQNTP